MKKWFVLGIMIILVGVAMVFSFNHKTPQKNKIREAAVAGSFYPGDKKQLSERVDQLLDQVPYTPVTGRLIGIVVPHAGYVYSGPVAASAYRLLRDHPVKRVVVISPSHVAAFDGAAVYDGDAYSTPLGEIPVDKEFCRRLTGKSPFLKLSDEGHETVRQGRMEHALEVQLPFLQRVLESFSLVPIVMGDQSYETCRVLGLALADLIGEDETLIVASSDLSHFHPYDQAVQLDKKVTTAISEWDYFNLCRNLNARIWEACGGGPIVATMIAAEKLGADESIILKYANSGDVPAGDKSQVVGYTAAAFIKSDQPHGLHPEKAFDLSAGERAHLLGIARHAVEQAVIDGDVYPCDNGGFAALSTDRGAFVTLNEGGNLRGCIGYTSPIKPLFETVRDAAISAAMNDPRFPSVKQDELPRIEYEISVLSPFWKVNDIGQIEIGRHGLLVKRGRREGLLLPQVATDYNWDRKTFLENTCRKAGLPTNAWQETDTDIFMFTALVFGDENP
jgi:hypothetical protein